MGQDPFLKLLLWSESRLNRLSRPESHKPHGARVRISIAGTTKIKRNRSGFKMKLRLLEERAMNNDYANITRQDF